MAKNAIKLLLVFAALFFCVHTFAEVSPEYAAKLEAALNSKTPPPGCDQNCSLYESEFHGASVSNIIFISILIVLGSSWLYITYKKKYIIVIGSILTALVVGSYFAAPLFRNKQAIQDNCPIVKQAGHTDPNKFYAPGNEFEQTETATPSQKDSLKDTVAVAASSNKNDEFKQGGDEFQSAGSEFQQAGDEFQSAGSEFENSSSNSSTVSTEKAPATQPEEKSIWTNPSVYEPIIIFIVLAIIGFGLPYERFRKTKGLFLLISIAYLGFYRGACPCMISSFENSILLLVGNDVKWISLLWFLALIPATYLFGKVWCGWFCHLGALQEFLFRAPKLKILHTLKAQKILKWIQISSFILLIGQLVLTHTNIWCTIDPFLVAFNLYSANITGWVLLGIMLVSSVFIDRPFCRAFCPVGLVLGWVSLIPGARKLDKNELCTNCPSCARECKHHAMIYEKKVTYLNNQDCIMCGDCMSSCKQSALFVKRKK